MPVFKFSLSEPGKFAWLGGLLYWRGNSPGGNMSDWGNAAVNSVSLPTDKDVRLQPVQNRRVS